MKAIVIGGTGVVGQHLVWLLLQNPEVTKVTLISRRKYQSPLKEEARTRRNWSRKSLTWTRWKRSSMKV